jgi:hypothetical protein
VRKLSDQVKFLSMSSSPHIGARGSPSHTQAAQQPQPGYATAPAPQYSSQLRQAPINAPQTYPPPPPPQFSQPQPTGNNPAQWYQPPPIVAPQASHPTLPPPVAQVQSQQVAQAASLPPREEWDDTYLHVLHQENLQQLQDLLSRSDPDAVMPLNAHVPLSQAVVLTLIHRVRTYSPLLH